MLKVLITTKVAAVELIQLTSLSRVSIQRRESYWSEHLTELQVKEENGKLCQLKWSTNAPPSRISMYKMWNIQLRQILLHSLLLIPADTLNLRKLLWSGSVNVQSSNIMKALVALCPHQNDITLIVKEVIDDEDDSNMSSLEELQCILLSSPNCLSNVHFIANLSSCHVWFKWLKQPIKFTPTVPAYLAL